MADKGTILAVDDTLASLRLLTHVLVAKGYQVRTADSGELALASVAESPPDLILLDIRMSGMDGLEVCRRLKAREESRDIPIIFLSASSELDERVEGLRLGAVDFISKPFKGEELLARVRTHLELRRVRARLEQQATDLRLANEKLEREIVERMRAEEKLRSLSLRDDLTGLYNRRGFLVFGEQQMKLAHRLKNGMLLLFSDMDGLKTINDTEGHAEGDRALIDIATVLKATFREADIVARLGGDEFAVLAMEASEDGVDALVTRLWEELDTHNRQGDRHYRLSLSIGVARNDPEGPHALADLLTQADGLMYQQKLAKKSTAR